MMGTRTGDIDPGILIYLLKEKKLAPLEAGSLAAGADYVLREFIIGKCRANIFDTTPRQVKQFAANWYIVSNLEPNMAELTTMLKGTDSFFHYCAEYKLVAAECADQISSICDETDYFKQRIDDFHNISGGGYSAWEQACPLSQ